MREDTDMAATKENTDQAAGKRCAEGSPVSFLLIQQSEDPRLAGGPDWILRYGPDAVEMEDVASWLRAV